VIIFSGSLPTAITLMGLFEFSKNIHPFSLGARLKCTFTFYARASDSENSENVGVFAPKTKYFVA